MWGKGKETLSEAAEAAKHAAAAAKEKAKVRRV